MLEVRAFQPSMLEDVVAVYSRLTAGTPYCYPLTPETFAEAVTSKSAFDPAGFSVAYVDGRPAGLIHAGLREETGHKEGGVLLFLAKERLVCRRLLAEAVDFLKRAGAGVCHVMAHESGNTAFYAGVHMGCEVCLWQGYYAAVNALQCRGFELARKGFIMSRDLCSEPDVHCPEADLSLRVKRQDDTGPFYSTSVIEACVGEEKIGDCTFHFLEKLSQHLGKGIGQTGLRVDERFRRQGIGSALLSRAHLELYKMGAREVILATNYALYPAIRLYEKLGYRKELVNLLVYTGYFD